MNIIYLVLAVLFHGANYGLVLADVNPPLNSPKFLSLPFDDQEIKIVQGWYYDSTAVSLNCPHPNDILGGLRHCGIDYFNGSPGQRETFKVLSASSGKAKLFENNRFAGNFVVIEHDTLDPSGKKFFSRYLHLSTSPISTDNWVDVEKGEFLGMSGDTGEGVVGIHLHFEVLVGGLNPLVFPRIDPYDIAGELLQKGIEPTKEYYPFNESFTTCGQDNIWTTCPPRVSTNSLVDVVFMIDSSGSMRNNDPNNKRLEAARAYLTTSLNGDFVGIVDFDGSARLASPLLRLPDNKDELTDAINTIDSSGGTNIGVGVQGGCEALLASTSENPISAGILLTDGAGRFSNEDGCFSDNGWPVYTFGIGDSDNSLLQQIATNTNGEFKPLPILDLICEFQAVRSKIAGIDPSPCTSFRINPLEIIKFNINIPNSQAQTTVSTSWTGSDIELTLTTPSGRVIERETIAADVAHDKGAAFEVYTITNPEGGDWEVELFGADLPSEGEDVVFGFTLIPSNDPPAPSFTIDNHNLVGKKRVSRTDYEYTYTTNITNTGLEAKTVTATVSSSSSGTTVVDANVTFGDVANGATVTSIDTFTIRQNRRVAFDIGVLDFDFMTEEGS